MVNTQIVLSFSLLLSLTLIFLLGPRILPSKQISLADDLEDLSLFRRAALTSVRHPGSVSRIGTTNPNPKIAFLFLTNTDLHFAPLWELFFTGKGKPTHNLYNIYVHADPSANLTPPGGVFEGRFIPAKKTERASPTLISAARRLLATAILDDPLNSYFALVSQHCVPLHSFRYIYKSLFPPLQATGLTRYMTQLSNPSFIEILDDEPQLWDRYTARGKNVMLPEITFEQFRVGSQFFILNRPHALMVIKEQKLWRKFKLPCLNLDSCYPEEHYFPTLLSMEDPDGCSHFTLTRVNWTDSTDGHPRTYSQADVSPKLIKELRQSNTTHSFFFARKFSPDSLKPLMKIASKVIFRD